MLKEFVKDRLAVTGLFFILLLFLIAAFAPHIAPDPESVFNIYPKERLQPPSMTHLFGTDHMGRDVLSRIIFGSRVTILISVIAVFSALAIGVPIGLIAGYYENYLGECLMRIADVFLSIPQFILAMALASALGPSIENAILALSITYWPWFSRVVYAETISIKHSVFIESTIALGASNLRTIFFHVLPNIQSSIIVRTTIGMGYTILTAAVLGFLGVGAQPPTPEWGLAISEAREFLPGAWWFATFPGLSIVLVVMAFNMFGDGLRDILDPKLRISSKN
jgi:peptide/nickel transport system permease protein